MSGIGTLPFEIVFLFGAGASLGASLSGRHVLPEAPPLMTELYDRLAAYSPNQWGPGSPFGQYAEKFRSNFEETFSEVVLSIPKNDEAPRIVHPSLTLLEHQWPLALYFCRFKLDASGSDLYFKLLSYLRDSGKIQKSLFGSLNYETLFEQAAYLLGLPVNYFSAETKPNAVWLAKLHGSCNFISKRLTQSERAQLASPGMHLAIRMKSLIPFDIESELRRVYSSLEPDCFPVMSQISPRKENFLIPKQLQEARNKWFEAIPPASRMVVIGVSHNPNDAHILDAISQRSAQILYIGRKNDSDKWFETNSHFVHLGETFEEGFEELMNVLGQ